MNRKSSSRYVWNFGSAARHHKLYAPWLPKNHCLAGNVGLRGAVSPKVGFFEDAAKEIRDILEREGVADMPVGIGELPVANRY